MLNLHRATFLILAAALATGASAAEFGDKASDYGNTIVAGAAARTVVIAPGTKYVNVVNGESLRFTIDGKSFNWHMLTYPNVNVFDLAKIAPQHVAPGAVQVYVSPDPLYFGN